MSTLDTKIGRRLFVGGDHEHGWQCWYDTGHGHLRIGKVHVSKHHAQDEMAAAFRVLFPPVSAVDVEPWFDIRTDAIDTIIEDSLCD